MCLKMVMPELAPTWDRGPRTYLGPPSWWASPLGETRKASWRCLGQGIGGQGCLSFWGLRVSVTIHSLPDD